MAAWYDAYRVGGFHALRPEDRADRGRSRTITAPIAEQLLRVKRERRRRSIRGDTVPLAMRVVHHAQLEALDRETFIDDHTMEGAIDQSPAGPGGLG